MGSHGEALRPEYQPALIDFIFGGELVKPPNLAKSPGFFRQLSNAMPYLAALLALTILTGMGWFVLQEAEFHPYRLLWSTLAIITSFRL